MFEQHQKSKNMIYVGDFDSVPNNVEILPEHYHKINPRHFPNTAFPSVFYTNNMCIVDCFDHDEIYCCHNNVIKNMSEHPKYKTLKEEWSPGALWSFIGVEWVLNN